MGKVLCMVFLVAFRLVSCMYFMELCTSESDTHVSLAGIHDNWQNT
jgi:hypothetical protein